MLPMRVVVMHEGRDGALEMLLVQNQEPVETLRPNCAHEALRYPVGLRRPIRCPHDPDPFRSKDLVESPGELLIPIPNQESEGLRPIGECPRQLPSLLRDPGRSRRRRTAKLSPRTFRNFAREFSSFLRERRRRESAVKRTRSAVYSGDPLVRAQSPIVARARGTR
jgi:hypothetical protein